MSTSLRSPAPCDAARLYQEREKRLKQAIALEAPDRVPVIYYSMFWHAGYSGHTVRECMYDYDLAAKVVRNAAIELQPDGVMPVFASTALGPLLDAVGYRQLRWPGHGMNENSVYQYIDREVMKADEYDVYLEDPSYFWLTRYFPRVAETLGAFAKFPQFPGYQHLRFLVSLRVFGDAEVLRMLDRLAEIGCEAQKMAERYVASVEELAALGFPSLMAGGTPCAFDYFADYLRGSKGIMTDMFRKKDKLLAAMERVTPILVRTAAAQANQGRSNIIFIALHWGLDGFMSLDQFKTFYWPQLRQLLLGLIERGAVPCVFWEGQCASRLETIADIPRGKAIYWFEQTDLFRAKEILGDVVCLRGNVPASMLNTGTPDEVTAYCRRLIKEVGKNGGFLLDAAIGVPDEARPENVKAMFRAAHEYGRS